MMEPIGLSPLLPQPAPIRLREVSKPSPSAGINLLDFDRSAMQRFFVEELQDKPFRGDQVFKWIHHAGVTDFSRMTNLSKTARSLLQARTHITLPEIVWERISDDGTHKWLLRLADGNSVETVFIPEVRRGTLCVSSQVGCALDCSFCSTGKQGFSRNLTVAEIIGQVWLAVQRLAAFRSRQGAADRVAGKAMVITNVVLMGMGEPLLNYRPVVTAMGMMMDDLAYGLSKYRVTLSTSGVIPAMQALKKESKAALAVSLHAPNDTLRNQLVPLNKKYPLQELMAVCRDYFAQEPKRVVTFEYVMLRGVNDTVTHARELIQLLHNVPCKLNLIPFNPFPLTSYQCSLPEVIRTFQAMLQSSGIHVTIRKTRGDDIDAACGQLVGKFQDRTQRKVRWLKKQISDSSAKREE